MTACAELLLNLHNLSIHSRTGRAAFCPG